MFVASTTSRQAFFFRITAAAVFGFVLIAALRPNVLAIPTRSWRISTSSSALNTVTTFRNRVVLAERIWQKTVDQRQELIARDWPDMDSMPLFPATDRERFDRYPYSVWDFVPASYNCPYEMERIGALGDGGKWVCGFSVFEEMPAEKPCIVYSFGINYESSFEAELLSRTHCEIWGYDFSVDDFGPQIVPQDRNRAHFNKAGISGKTQTIGNDRFYTIKDAMEANGHSYIDILKIDIEYHEFAATEQLMLDSPGDVPIGQMLMEIHLFSGENATAAQLIKWWEKMEGRGFRPTWTEPNLLCTTLRLESNGDPRLSEYTWINTIDSHSMLFAAGRV